MNAEFITQEVALNLLENAQTQGTQIEKQPSPGADIYTIRDVSGHFVLIMGHDTFIRVDEAA